MNYLTVAAIVKNEEDYIEEWLDFHLKQGVEHFYIYENESTDRTIAKLLNFTGKVTIIPWSVSPGQFSAYNHALKYFKHDSRWIAFIDVDEFLMPSERFLNLPKVLKDFEPYAAVAVHWLMYGSSGHLKKPDMPVVTAYICRDVHVNPHVKCIVQPTKVKSLGKDPHYFIVNEGQKAVDENFNVLKEPYSLLENGTVDKLRINHYHVKSKEEYLNRKKLGTPDTGKVLSEEEILKNFEANDCNDISDTLALHHYFHQSANYAFKYL